MSLALAHRGPDDSGEYFDEDTAVYLGHRRLSILDLTSLGHQPMADPSGRYRIVYNGEVYNFRELRDELGRSGVRFQTSTDTEVVLHAYIQHGTRCVEQFRGMFALAIYDRREKSIFLARDRLGVKPLLYAKVRGGPTIFASELKALLASGLIDRRADIQSIWDYLSMGSVPQPATILAGVRALEPGHWMILDSSGERGKQRYWDLAEAAKRSYPNAARIRPAEAVEQVRSLLEEATRLHMIADVPIGAFLSGGIDSTAVVALMNRHVSQPIRTVSVGFESKHRQMDELAWARRAARYLRSDHDEIVVTGQDAADSFEDVLWAIDQPSIDGTNSYFVSQAARRLVTVALSGLGGDELFAGYAHFRSLLSLTTWDRLPLSAVKLLSRVIPTRAWPAKSLAQLRGPSRYAQLRSLLDEPGKRQITIDSLHARRSLKSIPDNIRGLLRPGLDPIAQISYLELRGYLLNILLRDLDAVSMWHSLEVRPILLDHKLVEFVFALPAGVKLNGSLNKPLLVQALPEPIPRDIVERPKMGFELPLTFWLTGPLRDRALAALNSVIASRIFHHAYLKRAIDLLRIGQVPRALWAHVMLLWWLVAHSIEVDS